VWMDSYGLTPKGRQDRRWVQPTPARRTWMDGGEDPYGHLRVGDPDHPRGDPYGHLRPGATTAPTTPIDHGEHP
jgi:hypothetical protein